jgi:hypothetical protein
VISSKESTGVCVEEGSSRRCECRCQRTSSEKEQLAFSRNIQGGEIDGQDSQRRSARSHQPLDLGKLRRV